MNRFFEWLRALLQRIFFWHGHGTPSTEFTPPETHDHALVLNVTESNKVPRWKQLRYSGLVFNIKEQRLLISAVFVFLLAVLASTWFLIKDDLIRVPAEGGKIIEALVGYPKYINPLYAKTNDPDADIAALVFSGLFRRTETNELEPDLAEKYEWSQDGKTLTITLREGLTFHDGMPVTSEDVLFTLRAAKNPAWRSTYISPLRDATFDRTDEKTIIISLKEPDIYILDALTIGILPAHIWQDVPATNALLADANIRPIGTGPFRVRSFRRNASGAILAYTLERFDGYHGIKPYLDQIEFRFFADHQSAEEALRGGQVNLLAFVSNQNIAKLTKNEQLHFSALELPQITVAFFRVDNDLLKESKIRQALELAVDRQAIIDAQAGIAHAIFGPYPFVETTTENATSSEDQLTQARKLLDEAGWTRPENGEVRQKKTSTSSTTPTDLVLTITVPDVDDLKNVADVLARQWSLLGARVEVKTEAMETLLGDIEKTRNDSQILLWNILLSSTQDQYPIWWSGEATGNGLNFSNLKDKGVDDAIKAIRGTTSTEALVAARTRVSDAIIARHPAVFLTRPAFGYVYAKKIQGFSDSIQISTPSDRFTNVSNWYVKTAWRWK